jgi:hypothetical protein
VIRGDERTYCRGSSPLKLELERTLRVLFAGESTG